MEDSPADGRAPDRELAELRARAYGPQADIDGDPDAQERLAVLEARSRDSRRPDAAVARGAPRTSVPDHPATPPPAVREPAPEQEREQEPADEQELEVESAPDGSAPQPPVSRAGRAVRRGWPLVVAGIALLALAGVAVSALVAPRPDAVLRAGDTSGVSVPRWEGSTSPIPGRSLEDLEPYGSHRGIGVWGAEAQDGSHCIFAAWSREQWTVSCAPPPLQPVLDLQIYDGMAMPAGMRELPQGSVLRFTRVGATIEVWEAILDVEA
ncbi:hypothetical protein M4I32_02260 [Microbacterium sp. LRZ72]|uniref:hypothetical protein n=1 Tax=Microbacterium sp. LRZ72 TaxID=2942481 RepID=UPI0029A15995|nr:hypothetical protein [Microbacterium sp. LRZ72]MDX2375620.1 hypothetical protein [Microbacterium sp. LRZ72]